MDATCTPADIRYPNDMSILNDARLITEKFIDYLYLCFNSLFDSKPRDRRQIASKSYIAFTKKRRPNKKVRRKAIKKQLNFLKRNIGFLEGVLTMVTDIKSIGTSKFDRYMEKYEIVKEVYLQQLHMHKNNTRTVSDRIVSISQPHVRPIVRGKAGKPVEFGAKISLSLCGGFSYIDRLSWDSFNESGDLISQVEMYHQRFGYYPESVHADKIYQTRENRSYCKERNIRMTGKPLGRPAKITEENKEKVEVEKRQRHQDDIDRIAIEGRFGVGKRKYGLGLIKSKLKETSEADIYLSVLILNLDKICSKDIEEIKARNRIFSKMAG